MDRQTLDHLRSWIGRREQVDDLVAPSRAAALAATLDRDDPAPLPGDALPPPWHWMLCLPAVRQSALGLDGHPARGGFLPPVPLPRRYSALTFNGHRIHYDRRYATEVEGYPGLVVHGPLIATLLLDLLRRNLPTAAIAAFEFKALQPLFDIAPFSVHGQPEADGKTVRLWARDAEGWLAMSASARLA